MCHVCGFICYLCAALKFKINLRSRCNQALKSAHPSLLNSRCWPWEVFSSGDKITLSPVGSSGDKITLIPVGIQFKSFCAWYHLYLLEIREYVSWMGRVKATSMETGVQVYLANIKYYLRRDLNHMATIYNSDINKHICINRSKNNEKQSLQWQTYRPAVV